jgi:uncharacterized protein (TIGR02118 family)
MQRMVVYLKRRPEFSRPEFFDWWLGQHRELAEKIPGIRRYTISLAAGDEDGRYDGLAELWYDDMPTLRAAYASPEAKAAAEDSDSHVAQRIWLYPSEYVIVDNPDPPLFKFAAGLKRRPDMSRNEFGHWWLERHTGYVRKFPGLRKYRVSIVGCGPETEVDGLAEAWFDDLETMQAVTAGPIVEEAQKHSVAHTSDRIRLFLQEHRIIA